MIIVNIIISCSWRTFENKEEMKTYMTNNYVPDSGPNIDKFREYNFAIAKKNGEENFSMTFIKPNTVVLTQRYNDWFEYYGMISFRNETIEKLCNQGFVIQVSEPMEQHV
tara:strand:+ start:2091 stop:2420 length:330 start_codon:yes stop_codon:yes gene_type:complete